LDTKYKTFHFQEIDWFLYFPLEGNKGKYADYNVVLVEGNETRARGKKLKLGEVLEKPEIERNYPHTVGYFKASDDSGTYSNCVYLELREIQTVEEFWGFLNAVNL